MGMVSLGFRRLAAAASDPPRLGTDEEHLPLRCGPTRPGAGQGGYEASRCDPARWGSVDPWVMVNGSSWGMSMVNGAKQWVFHEPGWFIGGKIRNQPPTLPEDDGNNHSKLVVYDCVKPIL